MEARRAHNPEVVGSSPASATIKNSRFRQKTAVFSNFLAENDFWGKTTLLGESSGKLHSKWLNTIFIIQFCGIL